MNIKKSGIYSIALLMGLFFCGVEMNAIQLPEWAKSAKHEEKKREYVEPSYIARYQEDVLRKLGEPTIIKSDIQKLDKKIKKSEEAMRTWVKELDATNNPKERNLLLGWVDHAVEDLKPQVVQAHALKYANYYYGISLKPEDIEKIKAAKSKSEIDREYQRIKNEVEKYNRGTFKDFVNDEKRQVAARPSYQRAVYRDLDKIKKEAQLAAKIPQVRSTWFSRIQNWLSGTPPSTAKIQQSSKRVPPMSPMRKQVQARYAALKQQAAAQQPNLKQQKQIESRMYEHPAIPTPESSYILPH